MTLEAVYEITDVSRTL